MTSPRSAIFGMLMHPGKRRLHTKPSSSLTFIFQGETGGIFIFFAIASKAMNLKELFLACDGMLTRNVRPLTFNEIANVRDLQFQCQTVGVSLFVNAQLRLYTEASF